MNLVFVYKENDKIVEYQDLSEVQNIKNVDTDFCIYVKALCFNDTFREIINKYRRKYGIPQDGYQDRCNVDIGYPENYPIDGFQEIYRMFHIAGWEEIAKYAISSTIVNIIPYIAICNRVPIILNLSNSNISWNYELFTTKEDDAKSIASKLGIKYEYYEKDSNNSHLDNPFLNYEDELLKFPYPETYGNLYVNITLEGAVSKNKVHKFIEKEWKNISIYLKKMHRNNDSLSWKNFNISERDFEIIKLRDKEKMSFNSITKELEKKFDTTGDFLYQDNIKTAYHRTKEKIASLL